MKIRFFSTILAFATITGIATAQRGYTTRVNTLVRDGSGQPVQGATVKFFGPFGNRERQTTTSDSTGRNGQSDMTLTPGRYLVTATNDDRGIASTTFDVTDRSEFAHLDMRLHTTRRPTIQFVLMSDDRFEPITNADIEVFTSETGRRDNVRMRNGLSVYEIPGSTQGGRFDVSIMSPDFDTVNKTINFRPRTDTSSMVYYLQMRHKSGLRDRDNQPSRNYGKLDGMIRLTNKNRIQAGDLVTVNVGLLLSETRNERGTCISTVNITAPNGTGISSDAKNVSLSLNEYANNQYDVRTSMPGTYAVSVSAIMVSQSGVQSSRWDGRFTFNVQPGNGRGTDSNTVVSRGDYVGASDLETDNRSISSHTMSLTITGGNRNSDRIKGWLAPKRGSGFHMEFEGTYDLTSGRIDGTGTMLDRNDKRWDIRVSGSPDRDGRLRIRLDVKDRDGSYNRTFSYLLTRK